MESISNNLFCVVLYNGIDVFLWGINIVSFGKVIMESIMPFIENLTQEQIEAYKEEVKELTSQEQKVLLLNRGNYTQQQIAAILNLSISTVNYHIKRLEKKGFDVYKGNRIDQLHRFDKKESLL